MNNSQRVRENLLFRYSTALEQGDFVTVAEILQKAQEDRILETMILELNAAHRAEQEPHYMAVSEQRSSNGHHATRKDIATMITYSVKKLSVLPQPRTPNRLPITLAVGMVVLLAFGLISLSLIARGINGPNIHAGIGTQTTPTIVPTPLPVISSANAAKVVPVKRIGKGYIPSNSRPLAYSPDGKKLAVGTSIGVWLYDTADYGNPELLAADQGMQRVDYLQFNGTQLTTLGIDIEHGQLNTHIWDLTTKQSIASSSLTFNLADVPSGAAITPDGTQFVIPGQDKLQFYDVRTGKPGQSLALPHTEGMPWTSVAFDSKGTVMAGGVGNSLWLWDLANGTVLQKLADYGSAIYNPQISPDDSAILVSANGDSTVQLVSIETGKPVWQIVGQSGVMTAAFSPDGKSISIFKNDGFIRVLDAQTGKEQGILRLEGVANFYSLAMAYSANSALLANADNNGIVRIWDMKSSKVIAALSDFGSGAEGNDPALFINPDSTTVAAISITGGKYWDLKSGNPSPLALQSASGLAFNSDWSKLAVDGISNIQVIDTKSGLTDATYAFELPAGINGGGGGGSGVNQNVAFSPDNKLVAGASFIPTVQIWDVATGKTVKTIPAASTTISLTFSPDSTILAYSDTPGVIHLWDVQKKALKTDLNVQKPGNGIYRLIYSPDGSKLLSIDYNGVITIWTLATSGDKSASLDILPNTQNTSRSVSASFNADGSVLALGITSHPIYSQDASGHQVITPADASDDGLILFDINTGKRIVQLNAGDSVGGVAFTPDGTQLLYALHGTIVVAHIK